MTNPEIVTLALMMVFIGLCAGLFMWPYIMRFK